MNGRFSLLSAESVAKMRDGNAGRDVSAVLVAEPSTSMAQITLFSIIVDRR